MEVAAEVKAGLLWFERVGCGKEGVEAWGLVWLAKGEYKEFDCAGAGEGWLDAVLPESFEVLRFIKGLNEGPLKALGFFYSVVDEEIGFGSSTFAGAIG